MLKFLTFCNTEIELCNLCVATETVMFYTSEDWVVDLRYLKFGQKSLKELVLLYFENSQFLTKGVTLVQILIFRMKHNLALTQTDCPVLT